MTSPTALVLFDVREHAAATAPPDVRCRRRPARQAPTGRRVGGRLRGCACRARGRRCAGPGRGAAVLLRRAGCRRRGGHPPRGGRGRGRERGRSTPDVSGPGSGGWALAASAGSKASPAASAPSPVRVPAATTWWQGASRAPLSASSASWSRGPSPRASRPAESSGPSTSAATGPGAVPGTCPLWCGTISSFTEVALSRHGGIWVQTDATSIGDITR